VHLEISERGAGKNGDRMIVEIPADVSRVARKTLLDALHVDLTEVPKEVSEDQALQASLLSRLRHLP